MEITSAEFVMSNTDPAKCPAPTLPEYAFIGRSNVGKSSLINMICAKKDLAKTSQLPGKTQLINHFIINKSWYLVDLPGYGYAKVSKTDRANWKKMIYSFLEGRENLQCVFVLVDIRVKPQKLDLDFIFWLGTKGLPYVVVYTKGDKQNANANKKSAENFGTELLKQWEELPPMIISSAEKKVGRQEILALIEDTNTRFINPIE